MDIAKKQKNSCRIKKEAIVSILEWLRKKKIEKKNSCRIKNDKNDKKIQTKK